MRYRVIRKQPNSRMCFVCGLKNPFGLRASFYELENEEVLAIFHPRDEYQSYPGWMHGGVSTAILDETIGRVGLIRYGEEIWGVTVEFHTRFRHPVPLTTAIRVIGRITHNNRRTFTGTGEILLPDGNVAVEGMGKYIKLPLNKITDFDANREEWRVTTDPHDPQEVELY